MSIYHGNQSGEIPGILPGPPPAGDYTWWEGGALWTALIDYWQFTGDTSYVDVTQQGLLFQKGPDNNYMPPNWTDSLENDFQGFWGIAAMHAAETDFQSPTNNQPQWLALAQAVVDTQESRWDPTCGGGLRRMISQADDGYDYKGSLSNGIFFNLAARLGRFTGNATYLDYANTAWDWMVGVGLLSPNFDVYRGAHTEDNCTDISKLQLTAYAGYFLQGVAFMFNQVGLSRAAGAEHGTDSDIDNQPG